MSLLATEIERKAVEDGRMLTMLQDGVLKALEGKHHLKKSTELLVKYQARM